LRNTSRFIGFLAIFQSICFWFTFSLRDVDIFDGGNDLPSTPLLKIVLAALSVSFGGVDFGVRHTTPCCGSFTGSLRCGSTRQFPVLCRCFVLDRLRDRAGGGMRPDFHRVVEVLFGAALLSGFSASSCQFDEGSRITVRLENLPEAWRWAQSLAHQRLAFGAREERRFLAADRGKGG